ncbi:MAG TPA: transcription antitermination factor NusB [Thermoanaerobaculia bacterium]|nr:transcription antitermination factor NusB [Thermoanaerobaculia bacterium]
MTAGKRRMAREMAVQMLYQSDLGGSPLPHIFNTFDQTEYLVRDEEARKAREAKEAQRDPAREELVREPIREFFRETAREPAREKVAEARGEHTRQKKRIEEAFRYARDLVQGTVDNLGQIDDLIRSQADNWRLERMPAVDRNILRLAVYEMLYETDTPKLVVVDEAIELAKKFGSEQSGRFVNGLLDGLLKQHTFPGTLK